MVPEWRAVMHDGESTDRNRTCVDDYETPSRGLRRWVVETSRRGIAAAEVLRTEAMMKALAGPLLLRRAPHAVQHRVGVVLSGVTQPTQ
jgi:hypothetical protein